LLDGSTSRDDWLASGCGGIVPFEKRPKLVRGDFVQNSNDSYWSTNPAEPLTGYSPLFGSEETSLSARTRLGLTMVQNPADSGFADTAPAGQDAKFGAAAELLESASVPYQATLGDVQRVQKSGGALPGGTAVELGNTIAWHGATGFPDGGFNAIGAVGQAVAEDTLFPRIPQPTLAGSGGLSENPDVFWRIDRGTSWHFGLEGWDG